MTAVTCRCAHALTCSAACRQAYRAGFERRANEKGNVEVPEKAARIWRRWKKSQDSAGERQGAAASLAGRGGDSRWKESPNPLGACPSPTLASGSGISPSNLTGEMTMTVTETKILTVRCRPFTGSRMGEYKVMVQVDGLVRVWDAVAGYYTTCHCLSESTQRRIRKMAFRRHRSDSIAAAANERGAGMPAQSIDRTGAPPAERLFPLGESVTPYARFYMVEVDKIRDWMITMRCHLETIKDAAGSRFR